MWNTTSNPKITSPRAAHRPRVLFFAEAVTLAHVARPVTLAQSLDPAKYEVHLAWDDRYASLFPSLPFTTHALRTIPSAQFLRALATGSPIYRYEELRDYVQHDQRLIEAVQPDLIVGDFRLSLSVSAAKAKVPHFALANAYWSPFAQTQYPMPDHPINRFVGRRIGGWLFSKVRPLVFARYAAPINRLRIENGLPSLGTDLRNVYTHGDHTLYADVPTLSTIEALPEHHHFIGPVQWSPAVALPSWLSDIPRENPLIYVNLGSSGQSTLLPVLLGALASMDVHVIAATAGAPMPKSLPANVHIAPFLPGDVACERAAICINNGGSPATQQALAAGKPVIGLPSNLDQHLNMQAITRSGAGMTLLREHCTKSNIHESIHQMLHEPIWTQNAQQLAQVMQAYDSRKLFRQCIDTALGIEPEPQVITPDDEDSFTRSPLRASVPSCLRAFPALATQSVD